MGHWIAMTDVPNQDNPSRDRSTPTGIVIPTTGTSRSTSALGRAVTADALRAVDPVGARGAESSTNWRRD